MALSRTVGVVTGVLILLALAVQNGLAIKCWECRSLQDPKCGDPFDNSSYSFHDCSQKADLPHLPGVKATMCRKIRQKVDGEWRYIRSCAWLGEPGIGGDERYCIQRAGTFNIHVESCTCNSKDGCNSASQSSLLLSLFLIALCASYLLVRVH